MIKTPLFLIVASLCILPACSNDESSPSTDTSSETTKAQSDSGTKHDALMGYKSALDTARSVTSAASENERKKQQAIDEVYK